MSGHSKWSQIKRQKGVTDARRGQVFTKLAKEIMVAAREGGGDPEHNFRLRLIVQKCRDSNMPLENIERAIKRATGEAGATTLTETNLEGYGPGGVAILLQVLTDNRNRTVQEIRNTFTRGGGNLGEVGCVSWLFQSKGVITVDTSEVDAEEVALWAIDAGAEDVRMEKGYLEVHTDLAKLEAVRQTLEQKNLPITSTEVSMIPKTTVKLEDKETWQALKLLDKLEEMEDVQRVFSNVDLSEEVLERLQAQA
ncbi:MAG TPA: YebC/PmpR family DNA-binding transcriptional regulator [Dehalococcoidia bacterium]|nr:YebC/PmpR family DNA-binding transcriptional regulator [Dehalococcoidia bacterium]